MGTTEKYILLDCDQGKEMLKDVQKNSWPDQPWTRLLFAKQIGQANCGIQSAAMVMSAGVLGAKFPKCPSSLEGVKVPFVEGKVFESASKLLGDTTNIEKDGVTLEELARILHDYDYGIEEVSASSSTLEEFRDRAREALSKTDSKSTVIVNYLMSVLGQSLNYGHHSPLASYHKDSDSFLILDVWPDTPVCWVKAEDLFKAMDTIDSDANNKSRGFIIVTYLE